MRNKIEILLVEDDATACKEFADEILDTEDMILIGVTNNATKALELIKDYQPHVVILDLELNAGSGNGLQVLQDLPTLSLSFKPYFLITTNNSSSTTYDIARNLGADFIMSKHQDNYSVKKVLEFLRIIGSMLKKSPYTEGSHANVEETPEQRDKRIKQWIMTELNNVGINPKSIGYEYLIDAILVMHSGYTQNICSVLAERYRKTEPSVERAMQNAINRAWKVTNIDDLLFHYNAKINSSKGSPTVTEFICYYSSKIQNEC